MSQICESLTTEKLHSSGYYRGMNILKVICEAESIANKFSFYCVEGIKKGEYSTLSS